MAIASYNDWLSFMKEGREPDPPIREPVLESWKRCLAMQLNPYEFSRTPPDEAVKGAGENRLLEMLRGITERSMKGTRGSRMAWLLCDTGGVIIHIGSYNQQILDMLQSNGITAGISLDEANAGTNGLSLAMINRTPAICCGAEHFFQKFHQFSEAAAPFFDLEGVPVGYMALLGMLPEADVSILRSSINLLINILDRELRLNRARDVQIELKTRFDRFYKDDLKPIVIVTRTGYLRMINPAAAKLFDITGKNLEEKNLDKLAGFTPAIKEITQSAIACSAKPMEIRLSDRHLDVSYEKIPIFSASEEFLGAILIFMEKSERSKETGGAESEAKYTFKDIIGKAPSIMMAKELATRAAETSVNVFLSGPSGTGKEMFAQSIHNASDRKKYPFVPINCAAIPREIAESELFGYASGAFTGASRSGKIGKLEAADKGTVFLDEIGDMPFELQAKLLRMLEERTITRIGSSREIPVNIRIIAATNKDIQALIRQNRFREDLYYRISVTTINLPSLSDSKDDIPELVHNFIEYYNEAMGKKVMGIGEPIMERFKTYPWPGNIRELKNAIEFSVMLNRGEDIITWKDLPGQLRMALLYRDPQDTDTAASRQMDPLSQERREVVDSEKALYEKAVRMAKGNISEAARILKVGRSTLYRKMRKFNLKF